MKSWSFAAILALALVALSNATAAPTPTPTPIHVPSNVVGLAALPPTVNYPSGGRVFIATETGPLYFTVKTGGRSTDQNRYGEAITYIAASPDLVVLYNEETGMVTQRPQSSEQLVPAPFSIGKPVQGIVVSQDGKELIVATEYGSFHRYDPSTGKRIGGPVGQELYGVHSLKLSPTGHLLAAGGGDGNVHVYHTRTWQRYGNIIKVGPINKQNVVEFIHNKWLLIGTGDGYLYSYDPYKGSRVRKTIKIGSPILSLAKLGPVTVAVGCQDGTIRKIDLRTGTEVTRYDLGTPVRHLAFESVDRFLTAAGDTSMYYVFSPGTI